MMETQFTDESMQEKIREVIRDNPELILTFRSRYITTEMWEFAITSNPSLFLHCKNKTYSICLIALNMDGMLLDVIDPINFTGEQYAALCKVAVYQNPKAIIIVPKEFRTTELKSYAYAQDADILLSEKKLTPAMVEAILEHRPSLIRYVVDPTDDMIITALSKDPRTIVYFAHISPRVRDYFEEHFPQYAAMFIHNN